MHLADSFIQVVFYSAFILNILSVHAFPRNQRTINAINAGQLIQINHFRLIIVSEIPINNTVEELQQRLFLQMQHVTPVARVEYCYSEWTAVFWKLLVKACGEVLIEASLSLSLSGAHFLLQELYKHDIQH